MDIYDVNQAGPRRAVFHWAGCAILAVASMGWLAHLAGAQSISNPAPAKRSGREIYQEACLSCHGPDGRGASRDQVGFETPLPDFTDCRFARREQDLDWIAIIHDGGPARGFSEIMPAFGEALSREEIEAVVEFLRGFCQDNAWPRGELNLPRPLITEKAFPEDEVVLTSFIAAEGDAAVKQKLVYEQRFGARNQFEVSIPYGWQKPGGSLWMGGVGDIAVGWKRTLFASLQSGSIFSLTGEVVLPTGNRDRGFGKGTTVFEPFVTFGQLFPGDSFLQFQGGFELPADTGRASRAAFWRSTLGKTIYQRRGLGRAWSPMVEFLGERELIAGEPVLWDVLPQIQVTLSARQHIMANFGVRVPVTHRQGRATEVLFYILWDWYDGGLTQGW